MVLQGDIVQLVPGQSAYWHGVTAAEHEPLILHLQHQEGAPATLPSALQPQALVVGVVGNQEWSSSGRPAPHPLQLQPALHVVHVRRALGHLVLDGLHVQVLAPEHQPGAHG
jgi:hypothetical protein